MMRLVDVCYGVVELTLEVPIARARKKRYGRVGRPFPRHSQVGGSPSVRTTPRYRCEGADILSAPVFFKTPPVGRRLFRLRRDPSQRSSSEQRPTGGELLPHAQKAVQPGSPFCRASDLSAEIQTSRLMRLPRLVRPRPAGHPCRGRWGGAPMGFASLRPIRARVL